jgi:hypothetical protein
MRVAILRLVLICVALLFSTSSGIASAAPAAPALGPNVTIGVGGPADTTRIGVPIYITDYP